MISRPPRTSRSGREIDVATHLYDAPHPAARNPVVDCNPSAPRTTHRLGHQRASSGDQGAMHGQAGTA
ncbi:hypothetical protein BI312_14115 [Xanthomonas citri pv. citri]|nr:hypothetical protein XAC29_00730 [Xanthomonas axonopodis Xac29-1]APR08968.1 hypothetical protein BI314_00840 [Xanthomonas citri pv. citri]OOW58865.1 hypothetical protein Xcnt_03835 [Xanthomonas campestris pv. centellae]QYF42917.1 hypothetical protein HZS93_00159 [Xanthomonas citri]CCG38968.1 hypothetical protein XMIN_3960 [Xanthomonas citri pv. mangiferaeindicae LMG 941]